MMYRKILHLDLDAFFCAVEELGNPSLKGKPFAVGGSAEGRGVVSSCSYAARRMGIHSAMPMAQAIRLCPDLIVVSGRHSNYSEHSRAVMAHIRDLTPLVQQISIDEAFLDVSDLPDDPALIARRLQVRIRKETHLPCSLGVATNKLVAKIATDVGKAAKKSADYPQAIQVVPPGTEAAFLAPLPTRALWGIGPKSAERLAAMGIKTIGQIAAMDAQQLHQRFGRMGDELQLRARGIDNRPVHEDHGVKSISQELTFTKDVSDESKLRSVLWNFSEQVGYRLRKQDLCAGTVRIKLRWSDFTTLTRQVSLSQPTDQDTLLYQAACGLFADNWPKGRPVRLIGLAAAGLGPCVYQPTLWETPNEKDRRIIEAMDDLKARYGKNVVERGRSWRDPRKKRS
jgi:DNA polymerase-4